MSPGGWARLCVATLGLVLVDPAPGRVLVSTAAAEQCPDVSCGARCGLDKKDCRNAVKFGTHAERIACAMDPGLECARLKNETALECVGLCAPDLNECKAEGKARLLACQGRLKKCISGAKARQKERLAKCALVTTACIEACGSTTPSPGAIERVSVDSTGAEADGDSSSHALSADGRFVAFTSTASNLVAGDTNGRSDVFVHDRASGVTERVSVDSTGAESNDWSHSAAMSADGEFVAFASTASNLVAGDTNRRADVFVHHRATGAIVRASVDSAGAESNGNSRSPSLSADGRFVAFQSRASNLVPSDTNGESDVFVHDRETGATTRVSVDSTGTQGNGWSGVPAVSADGRLVAFQSQASNLVLGDTNGVTDVFVHDRESGVTTRVSLDPAGTEGRTCAETPAISADGRFVVFERRGARCFGDESFTEVFVHDRESGATTPIWSAHTGVTNFWPAISGDGRWVAFGGDPTALFERRANVFLYDRETGSTSDISVNSAGIGGNGASFNPVLSFDGRFVAFQSSASNLVPGDTNGVSDIFVVDRGPQ